MEKTINVLWCGPYQVMDPNLRDDLYRIFGNNISLNIIPFTRDYLQWQGILMMSNTYKCNVIAENMLSYSDLGNLLQHIDDEKIIIRPVLYKRKTRYPNFKTDNAKYSIKYTGWEQVIKAEPVPSNIIRTINTTATDAVAITTVLL